MSLSPWKAASLLYSMDRNNKEWEQQNSRYKSLLPLVLNAHAHCLLLINYYQIRNHSSLLPFEAIESAVWASRCHFSV